MSQIVTEADSFYAAGNYAEAEKRYRLLSINSQKNIKENGLIGLGNSLYAQKKYDKAVEIYDSLLKTLPIYKGEKLNAYKRYAQALAAMQRHKDSEYYFGKYLEYLNLERVGENLNKSDLVRNQSNFAIEYLNVNTKAAEMSPVFYQDGIAYSSIQQIDAQKKVFELNAWRLDSSYNSGGKIHKVDAINQLLRLNEIPADSSLLLYPLFESGAVFYANDQKVIVTRKVWSEARKAFCFQMFFSERTAKGWSNFQPFKYNSLSYSNLYPTISANGELMIFSSDKPGGKGGLDLYVCKWINETWSEPKLLGGNVNTEANEVYAYLDSNNKLYYSSNKSGGVGGYDFYSVFLSSSGEQAVVEPVNLGTPINSSYDELGLIIAGNSGYFSSNRRNSPKDFDIYKFTQIGELDECKDIIVRARDINTKEPLLFFKVSYGQQNNLVLITTQTETGELELCLEGNETIELVVNKEGYYPKTVLFNWSTKELLVDLRPIEVSKPLRFKKMKVQTLTAQNAKDYRVQVKNTAGESIGGVEVTLLNRTTGEKIVRSSSQNGEFSFERNLNVPYKLLFEKFGYAPVELVLDATKKNVPVPVSIFDSNFYKVDETIRVENIYYADWSYKLSASAKKELNRLIAILEKKSDVGIEIITHTDSRGDEVTNQILSEKKSQEIYQYITRYIDPFRVRAFGKGESQLLNNCKDGVDCTEAEHAKNRRTEFKIYRMSRL